MKKSFSLFVVVFALMFGMAGIDRQATRSALPSIVAHQTRGDEPRELRDPIDRVVRLLKRLLHIGTNLDDGMTPPKP